MAIAHESNTSLAFDTRVLKKAAKDYSEVATDLREMATELDTLLQQLEASGWTTPAGTAFHDMTNTNWKQNIEKYAALLDTLNSILVRAADEYEDLVDNHINKTKVSINNGGGGGGRF